MVEETVEILHNLFGLFHASLALQAGGEETALRLDDVIAEGTKTLHVLLRRGVLIHVEVHGRSNEDGCLHRQIGRDEHVVCHATCHLAQRRCRAGCNEHGVSP